MQYQSCPRCNMFLAPGAQICPNCQLNLMQMPFQQQPHHYVPAGGTVETTKEKHYRKLLMIVVIMLFAELLINKIPSLLSDWFGMSLYSMMRPLHWLSALAWGGLPLVIALILPKANSIRVLLIVFASIYAAWHIGSYFYYEFFYSYDDYEYQNF